MKLAQTILSELANGGQAVAPASWSAPVLWRFSRGARKRQRAAAVQNLAEFRARLSVRPAGTNCRREPKTISPSRVRTGVVNDWKQRIIAKPMGLFNVGCRSEEHTDSRKHAAIDRNTTQ